MSEPVHAAFAHDIDGDIEYCGRCENPRQHFMRKKLPCCRCEQRAHWVTQFIEHHPAQYSSDPLTVPLVPTFVREQMFLAASLKFPLTMGNVMLWCYP